MFADIRRFNSLVVNNCSLLTHPSYDSTPIDLQERSSDVVIPDYFNDPHICLTSLGN